MDEATTGQLVENCIVKQAEQAIGKHAGEQSSSKASAAVPTLDSPHNRL